MTQEQLPLPAADNLSAPELDTTGAVIMAPSVLPKRDTYAEGINIPKFITPALPDVKRTESVDTSSVVTNSLPQLYIGIIYESLDAYTTTSIIQDLIALAGQDSLAGYVTCVCSPNAAELEPLVRGTSIARRIVFQTGQLDKCGTVVRYYRNKVPPLPRGLAPSVLENKRVGPSLEPLRPTFTSNKPEPNIYRTPTTRPLPTGNNPAYMPSPSRVVNPYAPAIQLFSTKASK
jgi:hypothetical protein